MEQLSHDTGHGTLGTMKTAALEFVHADMEDRHEPLRPAEDMELQELKREADGMMALTGFLLTRDVGADQARQQQFADHLLEHASASENLLETLRDHGQAFYLPIMLGGFRRLRDQAASRPLMERLEYYREAYYRRVPQPRGQEANYVTSENLLLAGMNTAADRFPHVLHALESSAMLSKLEKTDRARLAYSSDHLPLLFAKLSLSDLENFTDLINDNECLHAIMVRLDQSGGEPKAYVDQRLFMKMRELYPEDKPEYAHRRRQGCPASVSFDGEPSTITELWRLTVGALEKAGYWR